MAPSIAWPQPLAPSSGTCRRLCGRSASPRRKATAPPLSHLKLTQDERLGYWSASVVETTQPRRRRRRGLAPRRLCASARRARVLRLPRRAFEQRRPLARRRPRRARAARPVGRGAAPLEPAGPRAARLRVEGRNAALALDGVAGEGRDLRWTPLLVVDDVKACTAEHSSASWRVPPRDPRRRRRRL